MKNEWLPDLMQWTLQNSFAASLLFLLLLPFLIPGRFRLPPQLRILCLFLFALRLFLPAAPESRWSVQRIIPAFGSSAAVPVTPHRPPGDFRMEKEKIPVGENVIGQASVPGGLDWMPFIALGWMTGCLVIGFATAIRWLRAFRRVRELPDLIDEETVRTARSLGIPSRVKIVAAGTNHGVAVFGHFRVTHLIVPKNFRVLFDSDNAECILRHELQHIKGHDLFWNWVVWLVQTWHWFNPLVRVAGHLYRNEREILCDQQALQNCEEPLRRTYGKTLIKALETSRTPGKTPSLIYFVSQKWEMKNRLELIMKNKTYGKLIQLGAIVGVVLVSLVGFTSPSTFAEEKEKNPAREPAEKPGPKDGDVKKEGPKDGEAKKEGPKDGEAKKEGPKDGDVKKEGPKDGDKPAIPNNAKERKVFAAYDKDGDGTVSADEMEAMMEGKQNTRGRREIRKAIERADKDNDEKLNFEEFHFWYTIGRLDQKG